MTFSNSSFTPVLSLCAQVSLGAIRRNIRALRALLPPTTAISAVVKSDGYGHGMEAVSRAAVEEGCRFLIVSTVAEAVALKQIGLDADILIAGPIFPEEAMEAVAHDIVVSIGNLEIAQAMDSAAARQGKCARIHLKIDTGMGRFGFLDDPAHLARNLKALSEFHSLDFEGALTHFSEADEPASDYTLHQDVRFRAALNMLNAAGISPRWIHAANSGGVVHFRESAFTMTRIGIAMYGVYPGLSDSPCVELEPAMSLMCRVADIRELPCGSPISYGRTFVTMRPSRLALLPVGYGNGYPRHASGKARIMINGQNVPIVGRITMNQVVADITDVSQVQMGDWGLFFGRNGNDLLRIENLATAAETIPYEILCNVGRCVPRVWVQE
jgi:alanine racemase